jgi:AcrR family transcriptional regulator
VLRVGLRRTTLTDVASRAGVSRMTMYRRWPDMKSLVGDLMTREWGSLVGAAAERAEGGSPRERIVDGVVGAVAALREHPVFRRIVDVDPETLLPYLVDRRGTSQDLILARLTEDLRIGQAEGVGARRRSRAAGPRRAADHARLRDLGRHDDRRGRRRRPGRRTAPPPRPVPGAVRARAEGRP